MTLKPIRFHPEAIEETEAAVDWYLERSAHAAADFLEEFELALDQIAAEPHRFPVSGVETRQILFSRFPYSIVFRDKPDAIEVAVAHGRRRPGYWRSRLQ